MTDKNTHDDEHVDDTSFVYAFGGGEEVDADQAYTDEIVENPGGGWADDDFDESDFDFEDMTEEEWEQLDERLGILDPELIHENLPTVAIVGRPNVGKSTMVNRFLGRREAVVEDHPGVTRDRVSYLADWNGQRYWVQDTGGWDPDAKGIHAAIARQSEAAMATADVIVMVVDSHVGITESDSAMAHNLQRSEVPVILVANKFESDSQWLMSPISMALGWEIRGRCPRFTAAATLTCWMKSFACSQKSHAKLPRLRAGRGASPSSASPMWVSRAC